VFWLPQKLPRDTPFLVRGSSGIGPFVHVENVGLREENSFLEYRGGAPHFMKNLGESEICFE